MTDVPSRDADLRPTPVMEQYLEIKAANPDSLLFYRMGDFYELFFGDAEEASRALGIVLTKRGKHLGEDIPMCGVPIHRADEYLQRLIALGFRVAVCEQLEDPAEAKKRGSKSVVRRDVVRLVTPGTITEDTLLDAGSANHLLAIARVGAEETTRFGLAWVDVSAGSFRVEAVEPARLSAEIARIEPREIVLPEKLFEDETLKPALRREGLALTPVSAALFDLATAEARIAAYFEVAALDGFGRFERAELAAISAVVAYVEKTQVGLKARLEPPRRTSADGDLVSIDPGTRANLEIMRTLSGERRGSLFGAVDRTVTPNGQRLLAERLAGPSTSVRVIGARADAVAFLVEDPTFRRQLREALSTAPDMLRPLGRLALGRGGPRDLAAIGQGLAAAGAIGAALARLPVLPEELVQARDAALEAPQELAETLAAALVDEPPHLKRDGGFVRAGWSLPLDEARELSADSRRLIARLEADYVLATGIKSLKIRHNNVLGFFVDTTPAHAEKLREPPHLERFVHRQTLANAVRFSTVELADLEAKIASAGERALGIEGEIFDQLVGRALAVETPIRAAAEALARLDVAAGFADLADRERWVRPIVEESLAFSIRGGRHPVVEQALKATTGEPFVANDCELGPRDGGGDGRLLVVTGPNMGGKSTYLRQNALIALLAQVGAFVPATAARIGVVDKLFSRVGAADDLARGRSTFMVEMVETAAILNQAGRNALVILDEIGRGTATFDGLSIAWATIEHLDAVNRCRALFATHYHELTALADRLPRVGNVTSAVREWKGDVVFLHEIVPGAADRSYGIQVARLAGLPAKVVERAKAVLRQLEDQDRKDRKGASLDELPLFSALKPAVPPTPAVVEPREDPRFGRLVEAIAAIDPDDLSPRAALEALYALKAKAAAIVDDE
ncbi:MAG: DNA mismatch repair protein MutS [Hyphomicrobiales bacterium]|nr:DNA mismatch repair protein MutS [Hyphomicrobiales bacterium]